MGVDVMTYESDALRAVDDLERLLGEKIINYAERLATERGRSTVTIEDITWLTECYVQHWGFNELNEGTGKF